MAASGSTSIVIIAMSANFGIAIAKFAAAAWTGSSAMLSEGVHSLIDTSNQALLLFGLHRSRREADAQHPFGYSKELYFWSFVVAIILFALGAGVSIYEGIEKIQHPHPISDAYVIYIVLAIGILLEGYSTYKALVEFFTRYPGVPMMTALKHSKDPALFAIVLEDIAAMIGLFVALIGVAIADSFGFAQADGIASVVIGLVLAGVSIFMAIEIKALIIGEAADPTIQRGLRRLIVAETADLGPVKAINEIRTMHLGPADILVAASIDFSDGVSSQGVEATIARLETKIKQEYPEVRQLFLEVQSQAAHAAALEPETKPAGEATGDKPDVRSKYGATDAPPNKVEKKAKKTGPDLSSRPKTKKGRHKGPRKKK